MGTIGIILITCTIILAIAAAIVSIFDNDEEFETYYKEEIKKIEGWIETRTIKGDNKCIISVDNINDKVLYLSKFEKNIIPYSDILGVQIVENGNVTYSKKSAYSNNRWSFSWRINFRRCRSSNWRIIWW